MLVSNESIRQHCNITIITAVMSLGYVVSILHHWRALGLGLVWTLVRHPISLVVDIDAKYLGWVTLLCFVYQSMIQKYATGKIQGHVLAVGIWIMVLLGVCLQSFFRTMPMGGRMQVCALIPNTLLITFALQQKCTRASNRKIMEKGLLRYLLKNLSFQMVFNIIGFSLLAVRLSSVFSESMLEVLNVFTSTITDSILAYYMFSFVFHVYLYNIKYFSKRISVLGSMNTEDTLYNYIVINSYNEKHVLDTGLRQKNLEIEYGYLLEVLQGIEENIYSIVKHQAIKNVIIPQNKVRDLPNIFLTAPSKSIPLQYNISNKIMQNIIYYFFTRSIYNRCLKKAETIKPLISKIKDLSWKIELRKKKKIITAMENIKTELEKLAQIDTSELSNFLSIWICYFSTQ
ncbi:hypothetical protein NECID01_1313 [Nematocida sp. AWRm77]|nr:hypothetical protein NECID01_1313 [Nematocida sp. AWRm77]